MNSSAQPRVEVGEVIAMERLGELYEVTAALPHLARTVLPGQFAQLRCSDTWVPLLRRPFSVAWTDGDICSFVFNVVGVGTRLLADLRPGDRLDALGPLGSGFTVDGSVDAAVCVSGGVGCAPFPLLIRSLREQGVADITVMNGAASSVQLYPAARFRRGDDSVRVLEATDDGSRGRSGRVTDLLSQAPERRAAVYACGPNAMLAALAAMLPDLTTRGVTEASLEAPMGCGFGTCLGCALPVRRGSDGEGWALCCTDGPVMAMRDVDWDVLLSLPEADVA